MPQTSTKAQTQAQLDAANATLKTLTTTLGDLGSINPSTQKVELPTADSYFRDKGEKELKDVSVESYDKLYNDEYSKTKDIKFTVGGEKDNTDSLAFYTYNAASEADKKVTGVLANEADAHQAYLTQQKNINDYITSKNQTAESKAFDFYVSQQLATASPFLSKGYVTEYDPYFSKGDFNKAPSKTQVWTTLKTPVNGHDHGYILAYKDEIAVNKQRDLDRQIYQDAYNKDPATRKKALADYTKYVNDQIAATNKSISSLTSTLNSLK